MRRGIYNAGYTMIEMVLATFLGLVVVLALGQLVLANQSSWEWGRDKAVLQANATEALEWMARSVRAARTLTVHSATSFSTFDENGSLAHTFTKSSGSDAHLLQDGVALVDRLCTQFAVTPNADTTSLVLDIEFEDDAGSRVAARTEVAVRNRTFAF